MRAANRYLTQLRWVSIEAQVSEKLEAGRKVIAAEEALKAKAAAAADINSRVTEISELQDLLA